MQDLWNRFLKINELLSARPKDITEDVIQKYESMSREWGMKFLEVYQTKEVTPYRHVMICHVGEFMHIHGCLIYFTQQGLEKYNDTMTKDYFRSSSHKGEQALTQIMQKQNRLEYFNDSDVKRPKHHDVQCSNCGISSCIFTCTSLSLSYNIYMYNYKV